MTKVIIVRHCEAMGNDIRVFQGITDADITENGQKQLDVLAEHFKNIHFDAIYSSPLIRAQKTAAAVNFYHNLPIFLNSDLIEVNAGKMEGVAWAELTEKFPEQGYFWSKEPWNFAAPEGDTMLEVYERIWRGISKIVKENPNKTVVAVSHGCAIRTLLCRLLGYPLERINEVEWCDNTGITIINFEPDLIPDLIIQNDNSHLCDEVSTFARQGRGKNARRRLTF